MTSFKVLAATPWVVTTLVVVLGLVSGSHFGAVLSASSEVVKVLGLVGCTMAALAFDRGDYMRRAWALSGACFVLLLARDATIYGSFSGPSIAFVRSGLVTFANLSSVLGTWMMARALTTSGLEFPGSERRRIVIIVSAVVVALLITGVPFALDVRALLKGDVVAIVAIASDLGDILSLCLIAPILLTALAMRGGLLRWPWGLFTAGLFAWLFYDATAPLARFVDISPHAIALTREALRSLACSFIFAAAMAHRAVVNWVPER